MASFGPISEFFFLSVFLLLKSYVLYSIRFVNHEVGTREVSDEENGPKRRRSRRLGDW